MEIEQSKAQAMKKAREFLDRLEDLTEAEKIEARYVFSRLHDVVFKDQGGCLSVMQKISSGEVRHDVLTAGAAILTAYIQEFFKSLEE